MKIGICRSNDTINTKYNLINKIINRGDCNRWNFKFEEAIKKTSIEYLNINIDCNEWIDEVSKVDIIVWKPKFLGVEAASYLKEKIYFLEKIMKKRVYPSYDTIWHFDSKIAQSYLFKYLNINTPKTFVTFDYNEAKYQVKKEKYPFVYKESGGAGSSNVRLIKNEHSFKKVIYKKFIINKILGYLIPKSSINRFGSIYFQEFMTGNDADLRITVIGDKYIFGFWRKNRKNDFRASGSGQVDYAKEIPVKAINLCREISEELKFDSMAYDLLIKDGEFKVIEMSYGYVDKAIYDCAGYYLYENKKMEYVSGNFWPQEIWIKWVVDNLKK